MASAAEPFLATTLSTMATGASASTEMLGATTSKLPLPNSFSMSSASDSKVSSTSPMPRWVKVVVAPRPPPSSTGTLASTLETKSRACASLPPLAMTLPQAAR